MSQPAPSVFIFDAYGTLFDVSSSVAAQGEALGDSVAAIATTWRTKQLEYTWVRAISGRYRDFWLLTEEALDYAMAVHHVPANLRGPLLEGYRTLSAYPEVATALHGLKTAGHRTGILSNGSPKMLGDAVSAAGLDALLDEVLSVETVGTFKTDARTYGLVCESFQVAPEEVQFHSSNRWDAAGAASFGFHVAWVNRTGLPDEYQDFGPIQIWSDLSPLASDA